jgi:hypothetical protein
MSSFSLKTSSETTSTIGSFLKDKLPTQPPRLTNENNIPTGLSYGNYMFWNNDNKTWSIGGEKISLGSNSGQSSQGSNTIALGNQTGQNNQGNYSIATGFQSGQNNQGSYSMAIGQQAGQHSQNEYSVSIGFQSGNINQSHEAVAIGTQAGQISQNQGGVAIGFIAGQNNQGVGSVAVGLGSGYQLQGGQCVSLGLGSGSYAQGNRAVSIGYFSGFENQGQNSIAIGSGSGYANQKNNSIAIGNQSGQNNQGGGSISIGVLAGQNNQGQNSIAIGCKAGQNDQKDNSIIINATGNSFTCEASSFNVNPIRQTNDLNQSGILYWNSETSEVKSINGVKTFVIDHPCNEDKYLVHACIEGPEAGVYYRGKSQIINSHSTEVYLPEYVEKIAKDFSIHITPISSPDILYTSEVEKSKFTVYTHTNKNTKFYWVVYGKRSDIQVEPNKTSVDVKGSGPYKWI